jgi:hypothetical protein
LYFMGVALSWFEGRCALRAALTPHAEAFASGHGRQLPEYTGQQFGNILGNQFGPNALAAAPCSHTAAAAARNDSMPCASKPNMIPPKTSPAPAVASVAGALALIMALPSGAAITVPVSLCHPRGSG